MSDDRPAYESDNMRKFRDEIRKWQESFNVVLRDQYGNPVPNDLIVLDWDMMIVDTPPEEAEKILEAIDAADWYEVDHPTRGKWLCVNLDDPDKISDVFVYATLQEWDIDLSISEIFFVDQVLHHWDEPGPNSIGFYHA